MTSIGKSAQFNQTTLESTLESLVESLLSDNMLDAGVRYSNATIIALENSYAIDAGDAVDKGGGKVGIPVTAHPFFEVGSSAYPAGETVTLYSTQYYDDDFLVDEDSTVNEVVITATYEAKTFNGTTSKIGLKTPRSIPINLDRKSVIIQNVADSATKGVYFGGVEVYSEYLVGIKLDLWDIQPLKTTGQIYLMAGADAGKTGVKVAYIELVRT